MKYRRLWRGRVFVLRYQPVSAERGAFKDKLRRSAQHSLDNGPQRSAPFLHRRGAQCPDSSIDSMASAPLLRRQGRPMSRILFLCWAPLRVSYLGDQACIFSSLPKYKFARLDKALSLQVFSSVSVRQLYSNCLTSAEALSCNGLCDSSESLQYNGSSTHSFREMLQQACLYVCDKFDSAADGMT